jgi:hypothetical protein
VGELEKALEVFSNFLAMEPGTKRAADMKIILADLEKRRNGAGGVLNTRRSLSL